MMSDNSKRERLTFRLTAAQLEALKRVAAAREVKPSELLRLLVVRFLRRKGGEAA